MKRIAAVCAAAALIGGVQVAAAAPPAGDELVMSLTGVDAGAAVQVLVWPNSATLERLPGGQRVPLRSVPVRSSGNSTYTADLSGLPASYVEGSSVNYELRTIGQKSLMWSGVKEKGVGGSTAALRIDTTAARVTPAPSSAAPALAAVDSNGAPAADPTTKMAAMKLTTAAQRSQQAAAPDACGISTTNTYQYNLRESFASAFAWSGAKVTMDFDAGSSHTLGVKVGSSQSGTSSISTSAGATVTGIVDKYVVNKVNYRKYINLCTGEYWRPASFYAILPSGEFISTTHANYSYCSHYLSGGTPWKQSVKNITYGGGVNFAGVGLSAQSGWNTSTKMKYEVTASSAVCGSTAAGYASSPLSSARKW